MAGLTPPPRIPLPRGWPRRVRSAVVHAISLAHFSLTSTRSWAANSWWRCGVTAFPGRGSISFLTPKTGDSPAPARPAVAALNAPLPGPILLWKHSNR